MATKAVSQLAIDETQVDDAELEANLEKRRELKAEMSDLNAELAPIQKAIEGTIVERFMDLPAGSVLRVGRFRVERKETKPRSVAFESQAGLRIVITADGDE
jgi:hypothetical protein